MKKLFILSSIVALFFAACDKVKIAYPENSTGLDPALFPGNFSDYIIPTFANNTNTNRNVLIEDFTGHLCIYCPFAAEKAHELEVANPGRVYTSTIHSGPDGTKTGFQATQAGLYSYDFTTPVGLEIGKFFGNLPGNNFTANPSGNVSRIIGTTANISTGKDDWEGKVSLLIGANALKVNLQSVVNYFDQTHGAYIHIEVDKLAPVANELRLVVALYQDSLVKPQKFPGTDSLNYVHRDLLISHVQGGMNGQIISDNNLDPNGKYYFNYSLALPANIPADNAHLLIYVFDKATQEVYQVIKKKFI